VCHIRPTADTRYLAERARSTPRERTTSGATHSTLSRSRCLPNLEVLSPGPHTLLFFSLLPFLSLSFSLSHALFLFLLARYPCIPIQIPKLGGRPLPPHRSRSMSLFLSLSMCLCFPLLPSLSLSLTHSLTLCVCVYLALALLISLSLSLLRALFPSIARAPALSIQSSINLSPPLFRALASNSQPPGLRRSSSSHVASYTGASLIRNSAPLGPYSRTMPRPLWWS